MLCPTASLTEWDLYYDWIKDCTHRIDLPPIIFGGYETPLLK